MEDAAKLQADVDNFFPDALWKLFSLAPEQLSLAELVTHRRVRNWLVAAESSLRGDRYAEAIKASAVAFKLYLICAERDHAQIHGGLSREHSSEPWSGLASDVEDEIRELRSVILGALYGVNMADYRRFTRHTPRVSIMLSGTFELWQPYEEKVTKEVATFCVRFAIDGVLTMQQNRLSPIFDFRERPTYAVRVVQPVELIVSPTEKPEVIRPATVGEVLFAFENPKGGAFVRVRDGEDVAYLPASAVVQVDRAVGAPPEDADH